MTQRSVRNKPPRANAWQVYVVRCADHSLYTGIAVDVTARLARHNAGKGAKYTRGRLPVALVYQESAASYSAALKREHAIKRLPVKHKRALISAEI